MSSYSSPPSPGPPVHTVANKAPSKSQKSLSVDIPRYLDAAVASEHASDSERGQSPAPLSSEPSSSKVPTVVVASPQSSTSRLSPATPSRSNERWGQSPSPTRSNSIMSEAGGGFEEWRCDQAPQFKIPKPKTKDDPWEAGYIIAREHDKEMCDAWREGIDKLLIFAGLFSAALVAFLTISCPMLREDPHNIQNDLLLRIASGSNLTITPPPFQPPSTVVVANMCWFFSLTVAFGTVLFGTVCLQWIREFEHDPRLSFREALEFRQMRYDGLIGWGVPFIISSLPLLLQLSLLLFFLGLSFFLQSFDPFIAAAISVLMALIVVFLCVTMMLPAMQCITSSTKSHDQRSSLCPFKSPHARLFGVFAASSYLFLIKFLKLFSSNPNMLKEKQQFLEKIFPRESSWISFDRAWLDASYPSPRVSEDDCPHLSAALVWLAKTYAPSRDALYTYYHCLRDIDSGTAMKTLQELISATSSTSLNWRIEHGTIEYSKDILCALALDGFVKLYPQLHDSLLLHRVELFVRILNQGLGRRPGQTLNACSLFEEERLAVPITKSDLVILDAACKVQLIRTFFSYLEAGEIHDFLVDIVIKMVHKTMTTKPLTSDSMLRDELSDFNTKLNSRLEVAQGLDRIFKQNVGKLVRDYVDQFGEDGYVCRLPGFKTTLRYLAGRIKPDAKRKEGSVLTE